MSKQYEDMVKSSFRHCCCDAISKLVHPSEMLLCRHRWCHRDIRTVVASSLQCVIHSNL